MKFIESKSVEIGKKDIAHNLACRIKAYIHPKDAREMSYEELLDIARTLLRRGGKYSC